MEVQINTISLIRAILKFHSQLGAIAKKLTKNCIFNQIQKLLMLASF